MAAVALGSASAVKRAAAPIWSMRVRHLDQLVRLRSLAIDASILERIHTDRRRVLMREGMRLSAQQLRSLAPFCRRAILAVTALELIARLTDEAIGVFDRVIGGLFRRAERRAAEALQANAHAVNDKIRLLAKLGDALIEARRTGSDAFAAIETVLGPLRRRGRGNQEVVARGRT